MKVDKLQQVFNLFDTNGRRGDTINAYKIYCNILEQIYEESETGTWGRYPNELTQFNFYKLAIESSPEVFKVHPKFDRFVKAMEDPEIKTEFAKGDIKSLKEKEHLKELYKILDLGIEDRARHYSSNLVKIGLSDEQRQLSQVGRSWIRGRKIKRSRFENLLPIDDTNLIFLRQLLKLRVYTKEGDKYYSPMMMAIYILLNKPRIDEETFITAIQMLNPYKSVQPEEFNKQLLNERYEELKREYVNFEKEAKEISDTQIPMTEDIFLENFKSGKSTKNALKVYREFYENIVEFNDNKSELALKKITEMFSDKSKRDMIKKAFGYGSNIFKFDKRKINDVERFIELNNSVDILTNEKINSKFLLRFLNSKRYDSIQEYGDVTRRVMKVTGIISFKNGIVELAQRDVWKEFLQYIDIGKLIFNDSTPEEYSNYEKESTSPFLNNLTIEEIFCCDEEKINNAIVGIRKKLNLSSEDEIRKKLYSITSEAFIKHVEENYPKEKILEILPLFSDRANDSKIQKMVAENTDVPTIFEYIVGIAWYHISSKKFDLFSSLNLSMSADFEPETHAGGGTGDIVIDYGDHILMLEVTLMNKQAQKRGEWEPVLRHSTNLTIESVPKKVTTLFIADELDENTINIWRAVATVPLRSSKSNKFAESVTIMPIKNKELVEILRNGISESLLFEEIKTSFDQLPTDFNMKWRDEIINKIS